MPVTSRRSAMVGFSDIPAMSQIVIMRSSAKCHNLCVAPQNAMSHIVSMSEGDKNGGPVTLKAWRQSIKDMTQADLADLVGTNANMIGYLESGKRALTVEWMRRLAPHLRARPSDLIDAMPDDVSLGAPSATVLTATVAMLLESVGVDPFEDERAQKIAKQFPRALRSVAALHAKTVDPDAITPEEEVPADDEDRSVA